MEVNETNNNRDILLIYSLLLLLPDIIIGYLARFGVDINQPTTINI
ncbi:hypothetical protein CTAM01_16922 [Colletotrichum tamarilloi]|uniref:Uncharacterized protein n=1 Tax=Colletotrichum tamarilloi TaxID=1209934 RepID=A0ABQ9QH44_9PEZI|nr:uncharacterized protein CTAM01_16922 [Colletotrichum tamarilloi]KAK1468216.1 hypothetical protein CTAM01_16922 [Colletotrichum tamarilloi]